MADSLAVTGSGRTGSGRSEPGPYRPGTLGSGVADPGLSGPDELRLRRVLIDTSVLAPEPLWLWTIALTEGIAAAERPQLFVTQSIGWELRPALRRIDPRLTRSQATLAARLRIESLTRAHPGPSTMRPCADEPRQHVLDPDDAHLDEAALTLGVDVLVTDDVHAFAPIPTAVRGYALLSADEFLCALTDTFDLSIPEAADRYRAHLARAARVVGVESPAGSASHRLRRSRARRFAKRVVHSAKASSLH